MQGSVRKKNGRWYYSFEVGKEDGKRKRVERAGGSTKKEALEALRKAILEFENVGTVTSESDISISDYFDYWFNEYVMVNCKLNSQRAYKRIIDNHIKPTLGIYKLKQINSAKLQEIVNLKFRNGFSKSYLSSLIGVLNKAFSMAVHPYQLIKLNPMEYVSMPKYTFSEKPAEVDVLTLDEFSEIINRFHVGSNFYIPLQIAFHTGMRAAEVMGLTWDCVNFEDKTIKVEKILVKDNHNQWIFGTPKTDSSTRVITVGNTLINILKKHQLSQKENRLKYGAFYKKYDSDFVNVKENGELLTPDSLKYLSRVVNYELGIKFNFHAIRHTHATMLLERGANFKDIQKRLGHSKLSTTMDTYSHVTEKMSNETVNIFENILVSAFPT